MFACPVVGCGGEVVFPDQRFADGVGVEEGGGGVGEGVGEGEGFIGADLEDGG